MGRTKVLWGVGWTIRQCGVWGGPDGRHAGRFAVVFGSLFPVWATVAGGTAASEEVRRAPAPAVALIPAPQPQPAVQ